MKKQVRAVMLAAAALAAVVSAQAATYTGDLIIGFTSQSGNDFEYDLGQASSLTSGSVNLSSQLSGFNLSTVNWGVVGTATVGGTTHTSWITTSGSNPNPIASAAAWSKINTAVTTMYGLGFAGTGAGDTSSPSSADPSGWNQETLVGTGSTAYHNVYMNPNTVGAGSAEFFSVVAGTGGATTELGSFTLSSGGILTFTAVPEPSTYGILAGMGLLALCLRRQFAKNAV